MDTPFIVDVKNTEKVVNIEVKGDLIINHIEKIKETFDSSINLKKELNIKLDNPSSLDITFIQLLLSLKKTYEENQIKITFSGSFTPEVKSLISNAGFDDLI